MRSAILVLGLLLAACQSPRISAGASGGAYIRVEHDDRDYAVLIEGSVDAAYKRIGNVIYVAAKGEGRLAIYSGQKMYLDKRVAGKAGWQVVIGPNGITTILIGYNAVLGVTGEPGSPEWMVREH